MDESRLRRAAAVMSAGLILGTLLTATSAATSVGATPRCDGKPATIVSARRIINGTNGNDVIVAKGKKNNIIRGRGGRDRICAGKGNDIVRGQRGNDRLFGGSGIDRVHGGKGKDDIFGHKGGDLLLSGGPDKDFINGGPGGDAIDGGDGDDVLKGGGGDDDILGDAGNDQLRGQGGDDDLDGGADSDRCLQGSGNGTIVHCEMADLEPFIDCDPGGGSWECTVGATNNGPDVTAARIAIVVTAITSLADCGGLGGFDMVGFNEYVTSDVAVGDTGGREIAGECADPGGDGGSIEFSIRVSPLHATDPVADNDVLQHTMDIP